MSRKKNLIWIAAPIGLLVLSAITIGASVAIQPACGGYWEIPPPAKLEFDNFHLITDQGPLYVGQTYLHRNEGPWVGTMTLVFLDSHGAIVLLRVPHGTGDEFKVTTCWKFIPGDSKWDLWGTP
jgi:hypothetical protein